MPEPAGGTGAASPASSSSTASPTLLVGTSGYSYKEWKGSFYPADLPAARMLDHYAGRFSTVEANNTFYRMPSPEQLERWAAEVPAEFTFALKAPQRITHQRRLRDCEDSVDLFLRTAGVLGSRLGPLLFQLPPNFKLDLDRLSAFLPMIEGRRAAFEFRHPSWRDPAVLDRLRAHGAAWCVADTDEDPAPAELPVTAPWGYLRLRGAVYQPADLTRWAASIRAAGWEQAFVYFKHEEAGTGPRYAAALTEIWAQEEGT